MLASVSTPISPLLSCDLLKVSVTAWMFTDEDLSSDSPYSQFSAFSFQSSSSHSSCTCSPAVSPMSTPEDCTQQSRAQTLFHAKVKSPVIDCPPQHIIDWRSYYESLTPTTSLDFLTPPTLTPTPTSSKTKVRTPSRQDSLKPQLSVVIPDGQNSQTRSAKAKERTFARRRRAVPRPLTLWDISNARGGTRKPNGATSLPGSPFILVKEVEQLKKSGEREHLIVQTPCDILSAVEFDLQAALQSATQNIPVSVRKVQGYEDQWKYYRDDTDEDEDDDACMSDPGTSAWPDSADTPFSASPSPSPLPQRVYPTIQRGRQNPFPLRPMKPQEQPAGGESTMSDLLRKRYQDVKPIDDSQ